MRVRARSSAASSRTCAFSRWRGAGLLIFSPCGPLRARLKESSGNRLRSLYMAGFARVNHTRLWARHAFRAPALDRPTLVLDADAACLHHQAPRRQGHHDLFRPLALPDDEIGPAADGAAVIAQIEDARGVGRDGGNEVAHQLSRAHV